MRFAGLFMACVKNEDNLNILVFDMKVSHPGNYDLSNEEKFLAKRTSNAPEMKCSGYLVDLYFKKG